MNECTKNDLTSTTDSLDHDWKIFLNDINNQHLKLT